MSLGNLAVWSPQILRACVILIVGLGSIALLVRFVRPALDGSFGEHAGQLYEKGVRWLGWGIVLVLVMNQFGFKLGALLGAAGVLGVAIGFASQTSLSNVISGLFLVAEQPFKIGDILKVGDTTGQVLEIGALSVKIRMFDNNVVRIPNETLLKNEFTNMTHFPLRRVDLQVGVAYKENLDRVRQALLETVLEEPLCLREPEPLFVHKGFGASSIDMQVSVWVEKEKYLEARNAMYQRIKERFDRDGIEIPFPHLSVYAGEATGPFPVLRREKA
jgi:small-conductance mechanosensitive channel